MKSKNPIPSRMSPHILTLKKSGAVCRRGAKRVKHGERIPEDLWISAAMLARVHPPCMVAHALSLDYDALKVRIESDKHPSLALPRALDSSSLSAAST